MATLSFDGDTIVADQPRYGSTSPNPMWFIDG
jgi:hypothetical protein